MDTARSIFFGGGRSSPMAQRGADRSVTADGWRQGLPAGTLSLMSQGALQERWAREAGKDGEPPAGAPPATRPTNYARNVFHLGAALVAFVTVALLPAHPGIVIVIAVTFATYCWAMEIGRRVHPPLNDRLMRFYGPIAHPHERLRVNSATWYATALVGLAVFAARPVTLASLAVLGIADPFAALVGRRWGKRVLRAGRSLEGSLAFLVSGAIAAAAGLAVAGGMPVARIAILAVVAGGVGAAVELLSTKLDDNLTIPLSVAGALTAAIALLG
jgi:dolichol kinase